MAFDNLIGKEFKDFVLGEKLGESAAGPVFSARNIYSRKPFFAKVSEYVPGKAHPLLKEYNLIQHLHCKGRIISVPRVHYFEEQDNYCVLIMDDVQNTVGRDATGQEITLPIETVLEIASDCVLTLRRIHGMGVIHADLKPTSIVQVAPDSFQIAHFGSSEFFVGGAHEHLEMKVDKNMKGDIRYSSVHTHEQLTRSRRDDLEMLGYVLVKLFKGRLPWDDLIDALNKKSASEMTVDCDGHAIAVSDMNKQVWELKKNTKPEDLCKGMPEVFVKYMEHVRKLGFKDKPSYEEFRVSFQRA
ncbi:Casein kinase I [Gracilariopsis chorda]|uniref:Casein kinase I n=1 Tax=Gracilariopsis chorda TaxID=448386 RepID=A0A2V3IGI1_9FLOR|nr:Casein kinase I [Gracilariopsis chorda]|eukprot:PXF41194.1 Casein kinase I [Gracilariopsis chorda]